MTEHKRPSKVGRLRVLSIWRYTRPTHVVLCLKFKRGGGGSSPVPNQAGLCDFEGIQDLKLPRTGFHVLAHRGPVVCVHDAWLVTVHQQTGDVLLTLLS